MRLICFASGLCLVVSVALISAGGCTFTAFAVDTVPPPHDPNAYLCSCSCENPPRGLTSTPARSSDDAEQQPPQAGAVNLVGNVLDMADDGNGNPQLVGIRFPNIGIPQGATIVSANVQFTVAQTTTATSNLTIKGQLADDALTFSATTGDLSGRPLTTSVVPWSPPAWTTPGDAGVAQRTTELSNIVQEIVNRPGWKAGNAVALIISGSGHRAAESFDSNPASAPQLNIVYRDPPVAFDVPACMPASLDPNIGPKPAPSDDALRDDCRIRVEDTVRGMTSACGYPSDCNCDLTITTRRFVNKCDAECQEVPLTPGCTNFSPKDRVVVATNAPGDTPVCTTGSPLAAAMFGRRSACQVTGTATVHISDETKKPSASGLIEIEGDPCPGASCAVGVQYSLDLEPIKFSGLFSSVTFEDLAAAGESLSEESKAVLDGAGNGAFGPNALGITARGRRGNDSAAAVGKNADDVNVGVDWTPGSAICALDGALIGSSDPERKRCEAASPAANPICTTDADCGTADACTGTDGACRCLRVAEEAGMTLALSLQGPIVNQPPTAHAGPDQVVECNQPGSAIFTLDGTASSDPDPGADSNIASFTWFRDGRSAEEVIGFTPRIVVEQVLGPQKLYTLRVIDKRGQADENTTHATVVDTTAPVIADNCNAPATITPPSTPVSFAATATDVCDPNVTQATITGFTCFRLTGSGKTVDKTNSCGVTFKGNRITIPHSNGVGNRIEWTVSATDSSHNTSVNTCAVDVVRR